VTDVLDYAAPPTRPAARSLRFAAWVVLVAGALAGMPAWIAWTGSGRWTPLDVVVQRVTLGWQLFSAAIVAFGLLLATTPADAIKLRPKRSVAIVCAGAVLLQTASLTFLSPILSRDVARYRAEGKMWLAGVSPYVRSPATVNEGGGGGSLFRSEQFDQPWNDRLDLVVDHAGVSSLYLPTSQAFFVLGAAIERCVVRPPPIALAWQDGSFDVSMLQAGESRGEPWPLRFTTFRLLAALFVVLTTFVLCRTLLRLGRSVWWAALFAWHPLTVVETGGMGHQDALGVLLLVCGIASYLKRNPPRVAEPLAAVRPLPLSPRERVGVRASEGDAALEAVAEPATNADALPHPNPLPAGEGTDAAQSAIGNGQSAILLPTLWLAAATLVKPIAFAALPVILLTAWRRGQARAAAGAAMVYLAATILPTVALISYQNGWPGFLRTANLYSTQWVANSLAYHVSTKALWVIQGPDHFDGPAVNLLVRKAFTAVTGLIALVVWWRSRDPVRAAYLVTLAACLLSPTLYPWYLLWALCLVPLLKRPAGWSVLVWAGTSVLCYQTHPQGHAMIGGVLLSIEYVPVLLTLAAELWLLGRHSKIRSA
jgi:hypothetical protein